MKPPHYAEKLILRLCRDSLADEILGDLYEEYQNNFTKKGKVRAVVHYWLGALRFINTRTLKRNNRLHNNAMLKNYIIIAFRNIARQKVYSAINIGGLATGIACSILLGLYILNELSYDQFHENADRFYTLGTYNENIIGERIEPTSISAIDNEIAHKIVTENDEIKDWNIIMDPTEVTDFSGLANLSSSDDMRIILTIEKNGQVDIFKEKDIYFTDPNFFNFYSFPLIHGR